MRKYITVNSPISLNEAKNENGKIILNKVGPTFYIKFSVEFNVKHWIFLSSFFSFSFSFKGFFASR